MANSSNILFKLLSIALGNETDYSLPNVVDWNLVIELSIRHGVAAIAVDGLQMIYDAFPSVQLELDNSNMEKYKYDWFSYCMNVEQCYAAHLDTIEKLAKFFENQEIPMMLLKGYGLSLNYPVPKHRPSGDIDVYFGHLWRFANEMVERKLKVSVDNSHHHHSVFHYGGFVIENHFDFVNVYSHKSNKQIEATFKNLAEDKQLAVAHYLSNGIKIYFPNPNLNALFIARHCAIHFASEKMILRQLLDWALFVAKHHSEIDWIFFWNEVEKMGMEKFIISINAISIEQLGFDSTIFHTPKRYEHFATGNSAIIDRVLVDIMQSEFDGSNGTGTLKYIWGRFKIWWHNRWKHKLVYSDSLISTFFAQIKSHLMKPATIKGC